MYFYAARQPILDRDKNLFAYELLFRDGLENVFPDIDGDEATSRMIAGSQFNFGLDLEHLHFKSNDAIEHGLRVGFWQRPPLLCRRHASTDIALARSLFC